VDSIKNTLAHHVLVRAKGMHLKRHSGSTFRVNGGLYNDNIENWQIYLTTCTSNSTELLVSIA